MTEQLSAKERERLEALFDRVAELEPEERMAFLDKECGSSGPMHEALAGLIAGLSGQDILSRVQAAMPSRVGSEIGPYRLTQKIGEGGMGEVYAAEQQQPIARRVALKVIKPGMGSAQVVARFEAERQALAHMAHPNIAQVFDAGATRDGLPYFVMELVEGDSITEHCDRHKLTTRQRLELFLAVCDGVQHAHQKGIIHRDLKPSNLLVLSEGDRSTPKIIDFGIARATTGQLAERTLFTMVGQVVGTLDYMSPEQADPTGLDIDTRSDVYSLGVVLYQLVSGLLPFDLSAAVDTPLSEVQRAIREQDPPTPSTRLRQQAATATTVAPLHNTDERALIRQLAGDLDWICLKALEKDPARRYGSAAELAEDVRRHLRHEPVQAGRPGAIYRARKFVRRNRVGVTAAALAAAGLVIGVLGLIEAAREAGAREIVENLRDREVLEKEANAVPVAQTEDEPKTEELWLWPPHPDRIVAMQAWLNRAGEVIEKLNDYRARLAQLEGAATSPEDSDRPVTLLSTSHTGRQQYEALKQLIDGLESFEDKYLADGTAAEVVEPLVWSVPQRLKVARELDTQFAKDGDCWKLWQKHLPNIDKDYPGLKLTMQMGLVPLGPDPDSKLWEFAHLISGEPATRGEDGKLLLTAKTGIVLVLVPAGEFTMGCQSKDKDLKSYDPFANQTIMAEYSNVETPEGPPHKVRIETAFFLSKFEMTQSQWRRIAEPASIMEGFEDPSLLPVNHADWTMCDKVTQRLGLSLPTEKQWEYAARANSETAWYTGDEIAELKDHANFKEGDGLIDGIRGPHRAGALLPNNWGFHDIHGNALEWCRNAYYDYPTYNPNQDQMKSRVARGGSYRMAPKSGRTAARMWSDTGVELPGFGLRPSRKIDR